MSYSVSLRSPLPSFESRRRTRSLRKKFSRFDEFEQRISSADISIYRSPLVYSKEFSGFSLFRSGSDSDSEPDRSQPQWKIEPVEKEVEEPLQDIAPSVVITEQKLSVWDEIMTEYEDQRQEYNALLEISKPYEPTLPISSKLSAVQYLDKCIFPLLCPILEETLVKAREAECLMIQKCRFNGLDHISELLWNRNPLHLCRRTRHKYIFDIPFAVIWLHYNPRPIYPLSWIWSKEEAIIVLQMYIRRYFVCKEPECSEMRQFWKVVKTEKQEEKEALKAKRLEELESMFNNVVDKLVADSVFEAEWKIYGCHCVRKRCRCVCMCKKWCNCCACYKAPSHTKEPCSCPKIKDETET